MFDFSLYVPLYNNWKRNCWSEIAGVTTPGLPTIFVTFDFGSSFNIFWINVAYNLKTASQFSMQFYFIMHVGWFRK